MKRLSRREVLGALTLGPAAALGGAVLRGAEAMRLLVHGRLPEAAAQGVQFGLAEAAVTASLMGRELQLGTSAASITGAIGVVAAEPPERGAIPANTPTVLLRELPGFTVPGCTFRVGLTPAERQAALERWRPTAPAAVRSRESRVAEWHQSLVRYGAADVNLRFRRQMGTPMRSEAWLAWFAIKALVDAALRSPATARCEALARGRFDGHKGRPLTFDPATGLLRQPLYVVAGDEVVGEIA